MGRSGSPTKPSTQVIGGRPPPLCRSSRAPFTGVSAPRGIRWCLYNNDGRLIGTWIGRSAQGEQIRGNYWLGARKKIGVELRHRTLDPGYLPQGGNQNDVAVNADIFAGPGFRFTGNVQYERWLIPLLATSRQSDVAASFEFSFWPTPHKH